MKNIITGFAAICFGAIIALLASWIFALPYHFSGIITDPASKIAAGFFTVLGLLLCWYVGYEIRKES